MQIAKPKRGEPCNSCGYCCSVQPCQLAIELLGCSTAPCCALEQTASGLICGLVRNPLGYLFHAAHPGQSNPAQDPAPNSPAGHQLSVELAAVLGIGAGCDSDDDEQSERWPLIASA